MRKEKIKYLDIIIRNTERLINIVNDLLVLSELEEEKIDEMTIEKLNISQLIKDIVNIFEEKIKEKNLNIVIESKKDISIESDPFKIEQIFINLIDNAIKYTPKKGTVYIAIEVSDKKVNLIVKDTGIGIPEKDIPFIFKRFYRSNEESKVAGIGLGLSLVNAIVKNTQEI